MQIKNSSSVKFGCKLSEAFEVDTKWNSGATSRAKLLNQLRNTGSEEIIIDTKPGGYTSSPDYDVIKIRKYGYKKKLREGARKIENVEKAINSAFESIMEKAFRKGKINSVAESLSNDFPKMKTLINELKNKIIENMAIKKPKKSLGSFLSFLIQMMT